MGSVARGGILRPPDYIYDEVCQLIANPEDNYVLLLDDNNQTDNMIHYYIEITNKLDRVIVIVADALYYVDAMEQMQIGFLAQKMAREQGVEYIIYQTDEGIVFSSRKTTNLLAIQSDPFLAKALDSDSIMHRQYDFQDRNILELVRPFATADYPYGLLRVGLSLESYSSISRSYDFQMIAVSSFLFILVVVIILYMNSRRRRREIARQFRQIKSISDKIFTEMKIGAMAVDRHGTVILANDAFENIMGVDDPIEKKWDDIIDIEDFKFDSLVQKNKPSIEKELLVDIKGKSKILLLAVSSLFGDNNEFDGMVSVVYDITEYRQLEQKSARKARLSELGNLAAGVAHEIRNPLNTISIAVQRLAAEFTPSDNSDEYLQFTNQIKNETKRLNEIITRFLALTREKNNQNKQIDFSAFIKDFIQLVRYEAEKLNITFNLDIPDNISFYGDNDNLRQAFINLFNNTKEALDGKEGEITITASFTDDKNIRIDFEDNGPGIPKEIRDKVFTPYYTTKESGTGLGLPTIYNIITKMGGDIKIETGKKGGAGFIIHLPAIN